MFNVEFHRGGYSKGHLPVLLEPSDAPDVGAVLVDAKVRAQVIGADNIVITNREGRVLGVFSTHSSDID